MSSKWWVPLSGLVFAAFLVASFVIGGEPPDVTRSSAREIVTWYAEHGDKAKISIYLGGFAVLFLVYFFSSVRSALDSAAGETGYLSRILWAGVIIFAAGVAFDLTLEFAMIEAADKIDPVALQGMQAIWDNDFIPFAIGIVLMMSATGLSSLLHGGLPKWLGGLAALIAIVGVTPWGFFAMPAAGIWVLITSVVLAIQARKVAAGPPAM